VLCIREKYFNALDKILAGLERRTPVRYTTTPKAPVGLSVTVKDPPKKKEENPPGLATPLAPVGKGKKKEPDVP
jgi:hypothetical protein